MLVLRQLGPVLLSKEVAMKPDQKKSKLNRTRRFASEGDAVAFFGRTEACPENPDWLVGAD
jgi:hypothetical protein